METYVRVRYRIDGALKQVMTYDYSLAAAIAARIKIIGGMDIAEKRKPQDGRITIMVDRREFDVRVSCLPTVYGEKIVIRILGSERSMLNRRAIGMPENENKKLDRLLGFTSGVIMIVGPTGSGKSSTMYTLVQELLSEATNLITLEDPVEYNVDGVIDTNLKFCCLYDTERRSVEQAMNEAGIPFLGIETDYTDSDAEQLRTRIEAFVEMLG
jgi:type IV pilus assembly protein PilB